MDPSPTDKYRLEFEVYCNMTVGYFSYGFHAAMGANSSVSYMSRNIQYNETVADAIAALSSIHPKVKVVVEQENASALICNASVTHLLRLETTLGFLNVFQHTNTSKTALLQAWRFHANGTRKHGSFDPAVPPENALLLRMKTNFSAELQPYTWHRVDRGYKRDALPPARRDHASAVSLRNNKEVMYMHGGWDGNNVLKDLWYFTPSATGGEDGVWRRLLNKRGHYLVCIPRFFQAFVDFFGTECTTVNKDENPRRRSHAMVALSTDMDDDLASGENNDAVYESLFLYGGSDVKYVPKGLNWNIYGWPGARKEADMFAICPDDDKSTFCDEAVRLE